MDVSANSDQAVTNMFKPNLISGVSPNCDQGIKIELKLNCECSTDLMFYRFLVGHDVVTK